MPKYDYELQCYIDHAGRVMDCGHPARMRPGCCAGGKYAGMLQINARAAAGIDAITAGDLAAQRARPAADAAFDLAIKRGILSIDPSAANYAGDYMFMGHHAGHDQFKHVTTRQYITPTEQQQVKQSGRY